MAEKAKCKSCGGSVEWSRTEAGKNVPLNSPPEKRFIMFVRADGAEYVKLVETWVSHFATCPQADEHRKRPNN